MGGIFQSQVSSMRTSATQMVLIALSTDFVLLESIAQRLERVFEPFFFDRHPSIRFHKCATFDCRYSLHRYLSRLRDSSFQTPASLVQSIQLANLFLLFSLIHFLFTFNFIEFLVRYYSKGRALHTFYFLARKAI